MSKTKLNYIDREEEGWYCLNHLPQLTSDKERRKEISLA